MVVELSEGMFPIKTSPILRLQTPIGDTMADTATLYPHRQNKDGSHNSMSLACFATVARSEAQAELAENHKAHVCDSAFLAERGCFSRAESIRHPAPSHPA
jgi:hypothetical protein